MTTKIPDVGATQQQYYSEGEDGVGEERRMEGRKGLQDHWNPYEFFRRSPGIVLCLFRGVWSHGCPSKSATKEGHRWSQCYLPQQTFVGQDAVRWQSARSRRQYALMEALNSAGRPHPILVISNLCVDEGDILMRDHRDCTA